MIAIHEGTVRARPRVARSPIAIQELFALGALDDGRNRSRDADEGNGPHDAPRTAGAAHVAAYPVEQHRGAEDGERGGRVAREDADRQV